jgi:hypothetical protein
MVKFEFLTAVRMTTLFFWVVTPYRLVGRYQRFGEAYCLHLQPCVTTQNIIKSK